MKEINIAGLQRYIKLFPVSILKDLLLISYIMTVGSTDLRAGSRDRDNFYFCVHQYFSLDPH